MPEVSLSLNKALVVEKNLINGQWVESSDGKKIDIVNPINEELIAQVPDATVQDVEIAVQAAKKASFEWGRTTPKERADLLIELSNKVLNDIDNLSQLETINSGHPISVVGGEIKSGVLKLIKNPRAVFVNRNPVIGFVLYFKVEFSIAARSNAVFSAGHNIPQNNSCIFN